MKLYSIDRRQHLSVPLEIAWEFFSNSRNLEQITPPELEFSILSDVSGGIRPGMIITYQLRLPTGNRVSWVTEIKHVHEPHCFIDEQRFGPYRFWYHEHRFSPLRNGVQIQDIVHYALPFGVIGRAVHGLFVRRHLEHIFDFRQTYLSELFGSPSATGS